MGAPLTLISSASSTRLAKHFSPAGTEPYPRVSRINSHTFETEKTPEGLRERFEILKEKARYGYALYKGKFMRELQAESRAGMTDTQALTHSVIFDIDGWEYGLPSGVLNSEQVREVAEDIVEMLPLKLQKTSYIAHASASFGMKKGKASVHLEFILDEPVAPRTLKQWLIHLNLQTDVLEPKLRLSNAKSALSWIIDPCVADNSRIIYIAPPSFDEVDDPFGGDMDERWVLVEKEQATVDIFKELEEVNPSRNNAERDKKIKALRKIEGLPTKAFKTQKVKKGDRSLEIISNPDAMQIETYRVTETYAIFDVNTSEKNGDSHSYWCHLSDPDIIYNFKDEPPFQFSKADPEGFDLFMDKYGEKVLDQRQFEPFAFRDTLSNTFFTGRYDRRTDRFIRSSSGARDINANTMQNIEAYYAQYGGVMPDVIPSYEFVFNPQSPHVLDKQNEMVNRFEMPDIMRTPAEIPEELQGIGYDMDNAGNNNLAAYVAHICPNVHKLIWHVVGNDGECYEHFINWLAYCAQRRRVSATAWVFSGLPGTGKGMLFNQIIHGIWGRELCMMKELKNFEDSFNGGLDNLLMVAVDEVHFSSTKQPSNLLDRLKHLIGSEYGTVRAMRTEQRTAAYYFNFMFFSNHLDAVPIEPGDRRFNICPAQLSPLKAVHPELTKREYTEEVFPEEVPLFASFLMHFNVNSYAAETCLENDAKKMMRMKSMDSYERMFDAFKVGNLDYFIDNVMMVTPDPDNYAEITRVRTAQKVVKAWIEDAVNREESSIPTAEFRMVYHGLYTQTSMSANKFNSMLSKNGIDQERFRHEGKRIYGHKVKWVVTETPTEDLEKIIDTNNAIEKAEMH